MVPTPPPAAPSPRTAIAIRTMILKNQKAYVQAGAGVVYDSVPENEFYETINKAKAMTRIGDAQ